MASALRQQNGGIIAAIVRLNYAATGEQVEQLAHLVVVGQDADATYVRVVLAHMQSRLGTGRRAKAAPQEPVLDAVHDELYPSVLKGVGPEDMDQTERNRKANFARSAASTVRYFIRNGGDVRALDVATATKTGLRSAVQPRTPVREGATRAEKGFIRAAEAVRRTAIQLARGDPDTARQQLERLMDDLDTLLAELGKEPAAAQPDVGATTTMVGRAGARSAPASAPMLHRGA